MNTARVGQELYPFLIVLVAMVLGGELALANRFYRNDYRVESTKTAERTVSAAIESTKRQAAGV